MNKELKQKLKDIGFESHYHDCQTCGVDSPTLSELIEACDSVFLDLIKAKDGWICSDHYYSFEGKTPEEAIVNLLLKLKKK